MNGLDLLLLLTAAGYGLRAAFKKNENLGWFTAISTIILTLSALAVVFGLSK